MHRSPTQQLLPELERFLRANRMVPTTFGMKAAGDPNLMRDLRNGRELRHRSIEKLRRFIAKNGRGGSTG